MEHAGHGMSSQVFRMVYNSGFRYPFQHDVDAYPQLGRSLSTLKDMQEFLPWYQ
jgi:hypothetical protein